MGSGWVGRIGAGDEIPVSDVEIEPALAVRLRVLALEDVRLCMLTR